jgi:uncharacterized membrane protein YqaE (UPF0057 family)
MKFKILLQFVFVLIAGQLMFSCNAPKYYEFSASKQAPYKVAMEKPSPEATLEDQTELNATITKEEKEVAIPMLEANTAIVAAPAKSPKAVNDVVAPENTLTEAAAIALVKERVANMSSSEKKTFKKEVKEALKQDRRGGVSIIELILAFILPPAAVFLHDGIGSTFWISVLLTILFFLPGVIYALLIVTDTI